MNVIALLKQARGVVILADNLQVMAAMPNGSVDLIYMDPPFNTGKTQQRSQLRTVRDEQGDRTGFGGQRYRTEKIAEAAYGDSFDDYLGFLKPRIEHVHRMLKTAGNFYFHIDYRESHYCKVYFDTVFGRDNFINEIIWAYDYGARPTRKWPAKHDTILYYANDPEAYFFDTAEVERIPYMAPGLVSEEKRQKGKLPTDTWWHTIVSPTGKEKLGYPTQKPLGVLKRIVAASCPQGGLVADFFAGSGTTGHAALELGRRFVLVDSNPDAFLVMKKRFAVYDDVLFVDRSGRTP